MFKGSLSRSKNENKLYKDLYCTLEREVLIRFIQRNQGHKDSMMHEFSSSVNKVNKAVAEVRTIGDRLPLNAFLCKRRRCHYSRRRHYHSHHSSLQSHIGNNRGLIYGGQ